jgi:hypothetical protein
VRLYSDDTRFTLTELGRETLLELELFPDECSHRWEMVHRGLLECILCHATHRISRGIGGANGHKTRRD